MHKQLCKDGMMRMVYRIFLFVLLGLIFQGCKDITQNSKLPKMSIDEIKVYFHKHDKDLKYIVKICDQDPKITFVDDRDINALVEFYNEKLSDATIQNIKEIQKIIKKLKIYTVHCGSGVKDNDEKLSVVSFVLYSSGLLFGGESQSIIFETQAFRDLFRNKKRIKIEEDKTYSLDEKGWFIVFSRIQTQK